MKIDIIQENFTNIKILTYKDIVSGEIYSELLEDTLYCQFENMINLIDIVPFLNRSKIKNICYLVDNRISFDNISNEKSIHYNRHLFRYGEIVYIKCENPTDIESMKKYLVKFKLSGGDDESI